MLTVALIRMFMDDFDPDDLFELFSMFMSGLIILCVLLVDIILSPLELITLIIYGIRRLLNR